MQKKRLDDMLIERGFARDRHDAFLKVTEGTVFVDKQKAIAPAQMMPLDSRIVVKEAQKFVGRGAIKLTAAFEVFAIHPKGKICADIGAATGGFTQVLLQRGAKKVYAIDTAWGKLALSLRKDPRVVVMEKTDIRDVKKLADTIDLTTIDVSLLSLREILPHAWRLLKKGGDIIALFKPQYETRDRKLLKRGIIRDATAREKLLQNFFTWLEENEWMCVNHAESPIRGTEGNVEYLLHLRISP